MAKRQVVKITEGKAVADVPVRIATIQANIENVLDADGIQFGGGDVVNRVRVGVGAQEEKILAEPLLQLQLSGVIGHITNVADNRNLPQVRERSRSPVRLLLIDVDPEWQEVALGSNISGLDQSLPGEFALNGEAVLIRIANSEISVNVEQVIT